MSNKLYVKWKDSFNSWIGKKRYCYIKVIYLPEPHTKNNKIKVGLDLPNYAAKSDLKNATGVDASQFSKKDDLASLKLNTDDLHIDKLKTVPVDLSKLSNAVNNHVLKIDVHNTDKKGLDKKINVEKNTRC